MSKKPYPNHRAAALGLLIHGDKLNRKIGAFLGQLAADPRPLSEKQAKWLAALLEAANLPPLEEGGAL